MLKGIEMILDNFFQKIRTFVLKKGAENASSAGDGEIINEETQINSDNEKNKDTTNVALMIKHKVLTKLNNKNGNNYINVNEENKKEKERLRKRPTLPSPESNNQNGSNYLNFSIGNNGVEGALIAKTANAPVLKTGVLRDFRVRNSVLSESLGQGAFTFNFSKIARRRFK